MSVSVFSMIFKLFIFMHVFSPWQSLSKLTLLIWLNENVGFHPAFSRLKSKAALQSQCCRTVEQAARTVAADDGRLYFQTEVFGYVELRQLGVDVCVYHREGVHSHKTEETHVAPPAVSVLAAFEQFLVAFFVRTVNLLHKMQELVLYLRCSVIVNY